MDGYHCMDTYMCSIFMAVPSALIDITRAAQYDVRLPSTREEMLNAH